MSDESGDFQGADSAGTTRAWKTPVGMAVRPEKQLERRPRLDHGHPGAGAPVSLILFSGGDLTWATR